MKEPVKITKRQATTGKIFEKYMSEKKTVSKIHEEHLKFNSVKITTYF